MLTYTEFAWYWLFQEVIDYLHTVAAGETNVNTEKPVELFGYSFDIGNVYLCPTC